MHSLRKEETFIVSEYKAMHEENFLSKLGQEGFGRHRKRRTDRKNVREEESRSGKREVEREEEKTVVVKRRCVTPLSGDVVEFGPMEDS